MRVNISTTKILASIVIVLALSAIYLILLNVFAEYPTFHLRW